MNNTVFLTVMSGVITYVVGQLVMKLVVEPVHEMKKTIGLISHSLVEHADVIHNPGVPSEEIIRSTSKHLRNLSSQLHGHLYLVPFYKFTAKIFFLPSQEKILSASNALMGLSNSVFRASDRIYEHNVKRIEKICDSLCIYLADGDRWPKEAD